MPILSATSTPVTTETTALETTIKQDALYNKCMITYNYLEMLEQGMTQAELDSKISCTVIENRKAFWEYKYFKRRE